MLIFTTKESLELLVHEASVFLNNSHVCYELHLSMSWCVELLPLILGIYFNK